MIVLFPLQAERYTHELISDRTTENGYGGKKYAQICSQNETMMLLKFDSIVCLPISSPLQHNSKIQWGERTWILNLQMAIPPSPISFIELGDLTSNLTWLLTHFMKIFILHGMHRMKKLCQSDEKEWRASQIPVYNTTNNLRYLSTWDIQGLQDSGCKPLQSLTHGTADGYDRRRRTFPASTAPVFS